MEPIKASINSIGGGTAPSLFERELLRIAENIADPETPAKTVRKITITFSFIPDATRRATVCNIDADSKLAKKGAESGGMVYISRDDEGDLRATTSDPKQTELAFGLNKDLAGVGQGGQ